ncbi:MAG TPA: TolC family protein [Verrucomicrobiae bacterium]|nr:TolC family protein [Verrucomicrobiae bacterium]
MGALLWAALAIGAPFLTAGQSSNLFSSKRPLSLRESFDLALARNLNLKIEHLTRDIAGYDLSASYGVYVPNVSFRAQHDYVSQPADLDPKKNGYDLPYQMQNDTLEPGISGKLPIGLSYGVTAYTREDNVRTVLGLEPGAPIRNTNNYFSEGRIDLTQHLLRNAWIDADRELILLRRRDLKISEQGLRFQIMKTLLAVELGYDDLVTARESVRVQEKALELRQQLVAETRRRVQVGDLPPLDAEQAETQLENTLAALTSAREFYVAQQNALKSLVTDDFQSLVDVELLPTDALLALEQDLNRSESFQRAMRDRPDLIQARLAVEKGDVEVRFRKNQLFPSLDLVGAYGGLGVGDTPGRSINNVANFVNQEYSYGVVLSLPLSNVSERGLYRASKASRQIAQLELQKAEQDVLLQIADFVNRAQSRFAQVTFTRKARAFAESALAAEVKKLQNGLTTAFFVLQLQETLTAARQAEIQAVADYNKILAQLSFAEGAILEKHHLSVGAK